MSAITDEMHKLVAEHLANETCAGSKALTAPKPLTAPATTPQA